MEGTVEILWKDPLNIIPAKQWELNTEYSEDVIEHGVSYGYSYGDNEERVKKIVFDNPWKFEHDRNVQDHEYIGDYRPKK